MAFQAMFRNPLATPFTLGVSAGASLGAAIYVRLGMVFTFAGASGISIFAFMGALLSIGLLYGLTTMSRNFSTATMLLAGVAISFFFSSVILFTQYISDFTQSYRIVRWLMGGFEVSGFDSFLNMFPFVMTGCAILIYMTRELNLITTGDEIATSRGVDVRKSKNVVFFATSLMVGGVVAISGPIGFVGMMSPHICRLIIGPNHQYLTPATFLFGGAFLTISCRNPCGCGYRSYRRPLFRLAFT
jgi:iron complex transport system permease protein